MRRAAGRFRPPDGPNVDASREFIKFALNAHRQSAWTKDMTYDPTNPKYMESMLKIDDDYWGKANDDEITRFNEWILKP